MGVSSGDVDRACEIKGQRDFTGLIRLPLKKEELMIF